MQSGIHVGTPPPKPLMVFDGDCNFCGLWIRRWRQLTGDALDYLPYQNPQIPARFPEIPREHFESSVQLMEPDGSVFAGAEAVFRALAANPNIQWPLHFYESMPLLADVSESAYRFVASHRMGFSRVTRWCWGRHVERPDYFLTRGIFLRALGLVYLVAFVSLWTQINGLIGHDGILPAKQLMSAAGQYYDAQGIGLDRYRELPTLCWLESSDGFLHFQCAAGTILAVLLIMGLAPAPSLILLWLIYLSLTTVGQVFLEYQWDNLLLEAGFLAIFLAPLQLFPNYLAAIFCPRTNPAGHVRESRDRGGAETVSAVSNSVSLAGAGAVHPACARAWLRGEGPPSRIVIWLLRVLLFKLMFSSGCVKLASGDPAWRHLTALTFHYCTQPLPTWIAWYASQAPLWFLKCSCAGMFLIELGAPFLFFMPRRIRFIGAGAVAFLQILILLTGNYGFFNLLTLALCLLLLDDFVLEKFVPRRWITGPRPSRIEPPEGLDSRVAPPPRMRWPKVITIPLAVVFISVSILQIFVIFGIPPSALYPVARLGEWIAPFRTINNYGLFAVMTTERHEIIVQGSDDGVHWKDYEFRYKPGDVHGRPRFVAPHQPRLDWQMWFAALGEFQDNPWFQNFCVRLLQGSPDVLALLEKNPFPDRPPRYVRAQLYDYQFTNFADRRATGAWWKRKFIGEYLPAVSIHE